MESVSLEITKYSYLLAFTLTWFFNILLLYLILHKTENHMKSFSKLLLQSAVLDFISNCIFCVGQIQLEIDGSYAFQRSGASFSIFPGKLQCIYIPLVATFYIISYLPIPFQSVYRYFIICKSKKIPTSYIIPPYFFALTLMVGTGYYYFDEFEPIYANIENVKRLQKFPFWKSASNIENFCFGRLLTTNVYFFAGAINLIMTVGFGTLIYTSIKSYRFIKSHKFQMSQKTVEMHNQLGRRLIFQAILPLIISINTIVISLLSYIIEKYDGGIFIFLFLPYSWIPIINAAATIYSIKSYRNAVVSWFKFQRILPKSIRIKESSTKYTANNHGIATTKF